jgi:hypothetical protein
MKWEPKKNEIIELNACNSAFLWRSWQHRHMYVWKKYTTTVRFSYVVQRLPCLCSYQVRTSAMRPAGLD